jgi:hypothetical protein
MYSNLQIVNIPIIFHDTFTVDLISQTIHQNPIPEIKQIKYLKKFSP